LPGGGSAWLVTRYDDVRTVLTDERFSRRRVREYAARAQGKGADRFDGGLSIADPADHARWRRMVGQVVNPRFVESLRPRVGAVVDAVLDGLDRPADLMAGFAFRVPLLVIAELFDVPTDLRPGLEEWAAAVRGVGSSIADFGQAMDVLHGTAAALVARTRDGAEGTLGALRTVLDPEGRTFSDRELVSTVVLLAIAGYETAAVQFGNGLFALLRHPDQLARLAGGQIPAESAVEEMLRHAQAGTGLAGMTHATDDVELGGTTIPAGSAVVVSLDSAARDETWVSDPDVFAIERGAARHHLAFGSGPHFCLGAPLGRLELQEGIGRLIGRCPDLRLVAAPDEVPFASNLFSHYPRELRVTW